MDPLVKELRDLLEQTEPYQRKMKAKHSRLKKRVIGHGGQKAGPPYSIKPSMERSKSAPPMGEGIFDKLKKSVGMKPSESDRYNQIGSSNIYVGEQPVMGSKLMTDIVDRFTKVYLVAEETINQLTPQEMESQKGKVVACPTQDTSNPTEEQLSKMEQVAQNIANEPDSAFVLVSCKAGMNRSAAIAARALVLKSGIISVQNEQEKQKVNEIINSVIESRTPAITMGSPGVLKYDMRTNREERALHGTPHQAFIDFIMYGTKKTTAINERIVRQGSKWCLKSKKGNKNLGCYSSKKGVEKRERQVQYFKHMKESLLEQTIKEVIKEIVK
jgi:hypothetical protein